VCGITENIPLNMPLESWKMTQLAMAYLTSFSIFLSAGKWDTHPVMHCLTQHTQSVYEHNIFCWIQCVHMLYCCKGRMMGKMSPNFCKEIFHTSSAR